MKDILLNCMISDHLSMICNRPSRPIWSIQVKRWDKVKNKNYKKKQQHKFNLMEICTFGFAAILNFGQGKGLLRKIKYFGVGRNWHLLQYITLWNSSNKAFYVSKNCFVQNSKLLEVPNSLYCWQNANFSKWAPISLLLRMKCSNIFTWQVAKLR